jgi:hypothetical protein
MANLQSVRRRVALETTPRRKMPTADELPDNLQALARRNAIELRNTQFGSDAERLIKSINAALGTERAFPWGKATAGLCRAP